MVTAQWKSAFFIAVMSIITVSIATAVSDREQIITYLDAPNTTLENDQLRITRLGDEEQVARYS